MFNRPLILILSAFIGGIIVAHVLFPEHPDFIPLLCLSIIFFLALFLKTRSGTKALCIMVLFASLGSLAYLVSYKHSGLQILAEKRRQVVMEGVIIHPPRISAQRARFAVKVNQIINPSWDGEVKEKVLVTVYDFQGHLSPGDRIRFPARLRTFSNFKNPGRYNYELAMKINGMVCAASVSDGRYIVFMGRGGLGPPADFLERVRRPVRDLISRLPSPENQALCSALLLGEKQGIDPSLREPFDRTGLGHLLAVSGLHIGLVAGLVFIMLKKILSFSYSLSLKFNIRKLAAILSCLPVIFYTGLTGFQTSSLRAMIMVLTFLLSIILDRERDTWSTLALAGLIILGIDPFALFSISFQLSFLAVTGILWLSPVFIGLVPDIRLKGDLPHIFRRISSYFFGLIAVTLAATIFLLPITALYFHRFSVVSIPANLITVPLLGLFILPLGLFAILTLPFSISLASVILHLSSWGLEILMAVTRFWAQFDFSAFWVVTPNFWEIILYYGFILMFFFSWKRPWARLCLAGFVFLIALDMGYWLYQTRFNPNLRVTYLDVGQGNAALVRFPGNKRMLIDGGGFSGGTFDTGQMIIAPYLWQQKIKRIDYLVLTHPQTDHMKGLGFIAAHFHPKEFWWNGDENENESFRELMGILDSKGIKKRLPHESAKKVKIADTEIRVLHPASNGGPSMHPFPDLNNNSLVLKITYGGKSLLFPGDLEDKGEALVTTSAGSELSSQILLAPHHGSRTSCTKGFLKKVTPDLCIISAGQKNPFGFPHKDTLKRLEQARCRVLRTDQAGAIQLKLDEAGEIEVKTYVAGEKSFLNIN